MENTNNKIIKIKFNLSIFTFIGIGFLIMFSGIIPLAILFKLFFLVKFTKMCIENIEYEGKKIYFNGNSSEIYLAIITLFLVLPIPFILAFGLGSSILIGLYIIYLFTVIYYFFYYILKWFITNIIIVDDNILLDNSINNKNNSNFDYLNFNMSFGKFILYAIIITISLIFSFGILFPIIIIIFTKYIIKNIDYKYPIVFKGNILKFYLLAIPILIIPYLYDYNYIILLIFIFIRLSYPFIAYYIIKWAIKNIEIIKAV